MGTITQNQAINYHWPFQKQRDPYFTQQLPILAGTSEEKNFFLNKVGITEAAELQWRFHFFLLFAGAQWSEQCASSSRCPWAHLQMWWPGCHLHLQTLESKADSHCPGGQGHPGQGPQWGEHLAGARCPDARQETEGQDQCAERAHPHLPGQNHLQQAGAPGAGQPRRSLPPLRCAQDGGGEDDGGAAVLPEWHQPGGGSEGDTDLGAKE